MPLIIFSMNLLYICCSFVLQIRQIMAPRVWARTNDGTIDFISLAPEYIEGANAVMRIIYTKSTTCKALGLGEQESAMSELDEFTLKIAKDGLSIIALERETNKVCGVVFNKLRAKNDPEEKVFLEKFKSSCQHSASRNFMKVMIHINAQCNLFEHCKVDCMLDMMFIATLPEFRNSDIANTLGKVSMDLAKKLRAGENVKQPIDGEALSLELVPQIMAAIFPSLYTRKIGRSMIWNTVITFGLHNFEIDGKRPGLAIFSTAFKRLK